MNVIDILQPPIISNREFFDFQLHNTFRCRLNHFQLRNVLALSSRNDIFFSTGEGVSCWHPVTQNLVSPLLDLSEDVLSNPIRISTLGADSSVLLAGGFNGNFALKPLTTSSPVVTGTLTTDLNGITNHIHVLTPRRSSIPHAIICSNDKQIRTLDTSRARTVSAHAFPWAVNASATAPDSRLRVVVGDSTDIFVVDAERGRTEFVLPGHTDYGFAAAWSGDGFTIATGNQDRTVRIYDARNFSKTVKVLPMRMAGCRSLRFSPGGSRVLAMAEPADLVHVIDAVGWNDAQTLTFWGEIGGIEFEPDGEGLIVANCDPFVGGLMQWGRKRSGAWHEKEDSVMEGSMPVGIGDVEMNGSGLMDGIKRTRARGRRQWQRTGVDLENLIL